MHFYWFLLWPNYYDQDCLKKRFFANLARNNPRNHWKCRNSQNISIFAFFDQKLALNLEKQARNRHFKVWANFRFGENLKIEKNRFLSIFYRKKAYKRCKMANFCHFSGVSGPKNQYFWRKTHFSVFVDNYGHNIWPTEKLHHKSTKHHCIARA